ncbi:hypothetical protein [Nocardia fluminea]
MIASNRCTASSEAFVIHAAAATLILLCAMVLAIYKPRGLTPFGIRARRS